MKDPNRPKKKINPASLANLRPAKKGEVRNPKGGAGPKNALYKVQRLTCLEVAECGSLVLQNNIHELQKIVSDSFGDDPKVGNPDAEHSALKVWMARVAIKGIAKSDPVMLDTFLNRVIGKVEQSVRFEPPTSPAEGFDAKPPMQDVKPDPSALTPEERRARLAQFERLLQETEIVKEEPVTPAVLVPEVLPAEK